METSTFDQSTVGGGEGTSVMMQQEQEQIPQQEMMPPVLAEKKKPIKVLIAIDDSEGSFYALKWALDNLFTYDAASSTEPDQNQNFGMLYLLNVQQPFQHYIFPAGPVYATTSVIESVRKAQEQNSTMLLSRALQICKQRPVKVETLMMEGDPKDMICQAAEQMHADLVVVGSRGLGKIKRAFLGSVSDYCAHHAKCPILIVKPPQ
ncbi:uncharacterized protein LOC113320096 isoform X2 [Papaver somniferum]|uniref:uncharacterized protein LOC113320096 isoform X2 n=1 Tax=Papaver somniferum TaxID=3469 RepID=UPI000E7022C5|nr:uncharacterized protein LOC113320096 isoform X2 [Papaver somniferum]